MPITQHGYALMQGALSSMMRRYDADMDRLRRSPHVDLRKPTFDTVAAIPHVEVVDGNYEWVAEECYCSSTRMPPCSWCTEHCWECMQLVDGCTCEDEEDVAAVVEESESVDPLAILAGYLETE